MFEWYLCLADRVTRVAAHQASEVTFSLIIERTLLRPEMLSSGCFGAHKSCMTIDTLHETQHVPTNSRKIRTQDVLKYAFIE